MAITNNERVGKALDLLKDGLGPFVEREFVNLYKGEALDRAKGFMYGDRLNTDKPLDDWDAAALLALMWSSWNDVFRRTLGQAERTFVSELRGVRTRWAHQEPFSGDDAYRALDTVVRLLASVSAPQSDEAEKLKTELLRVRFEEQLRSEKRRSAGAAVESQATGNLKPWREVVNPHKDVASGQYQQAEFAADLWQVHLGEGTDEYRDPVEFFRRTYLTASLKELLVGSVRKLAGTGGDPVIQLQTNFGGGKTHSMLALYHLFSGVTATDLPGIDEVLREAGVSAAPAVKRVVIVGNKISPGNPVTKSDGTVVRTLWGELAWQLGLAKGGVAEARKAFERVRADDERATSPGDVLRVLMDDYGPCLILIDEWVAYARQLHDMSNRADDGSDLPGGPFETHFTFAQALTESAKNAKRCLLVISLPASDTTGSPHAVADDIEVGGERGRAALDRLRNAVGRVEASWRPASAEEGFEIVRRRLFEPISTREQFVARDSVARSFFDFYRLQQQEFPPEAHEPAYEKRLRDAYPIHPEIFDRLYGDWSTLVKFQRTRGVLRLMAAVIHSLWEQGDRNPLIMPGNIGINDPRVQFELTRYLSDNWAPVIEKDVDGPNALPNRIDSDVPNLGKYQATRRVARAIYLGSAPTADAANRGIEDRRIKLGTVMPEESPAVFGDALRRLATAATYLFQDGSRYWYSTQATVTKVADDMAEQLRREPDKVATEIEKRVRADTAVYEPFRRIHVMPQNGQEIVDDLDARLVVLGPDFPYAKEVGNRAEAAAVAMLAQRGGTPRIFQNTLAFLAVDQTRLQDLDEAVRRFLAWSSVVAQADSLNLSPHQLRQAQAQLASANTTVTARLPEAYQWLIVPVQDKPTEAVRMEAYRLSGQEKLAVRAGKKLKSEELLVGRLAGTRLRMELDRVPLWRGNHVSIRQLIDDFARYHYLPRLEGPDVLVEAVRDGLGIVLWEQEGFAYADSYDEHADRYVGLRVNESVRLTANDASGLLVRPETALAQIAREKPIEKPEPPIVDPPGPGDPPRPPEPPAGPKAPTRYHGSVRLDPTRAGRDAGRIADEVLAHLVSVVGSTVTVTLEVEASIPSGAPDSVVRTVTQNGKDLRFEPGSGFEGE
jgi:predicted AAA+ superfamily ATPase